MDRPLCSCSHCEESGREESTWFHEAERRLREAICESLAKGDWQAVYEDALIGRAVFGRKDSGVAAS